MAQSTGAGRAAPLAGATKPGLPLLDAGVRATATGNSDSHRIAYQEAGVPRNFVFLGERRDDPAKLDTPAWLC